MIDLKEAIERSKKFIVEMNGEAEQLEVEEIVLSENKKKWEVTLSYLQKIQSPNALQKTLGLEAHRVYKKLVIDSENEDVIGMYNWTYGRREAA